VSKKKIYSFSIQVKVESQLSRDILHALAMSGWNAFGIYELVKQEIATEKRLRKAMPKDMYDVFIPIK
jgi:hypothetical protein